MACAIRLLQLLERRPGADRAPRRGAGRGDREGPRRRSAPALRRRDEPERDPRAAARTTTRGRTTARSSARRSTSCLNKQARGAAEADAAAVPQPRQLRGQRRRAQPLAGREGRGDGRLRPHRDRRATKLLVEDGKVVGVRTGDKGRDKSGGEKGNFEPGSDVIAKATVLAEGCWGHLTGAALKALDLAPKDPQVWALGVKEVWEVEQPFEKIVHTLGWPLRAGAKWKEFGGSWIYGMNREGETPKVSIGFVTGLDYTDARFSRPRRAAGVQAAPAGQEDPRRRQARGLGREGDPRGRLLGDADAARAGHGHRRRRRRHGQRPQAQGHPLRDRVRPAGGGDDLPAAQGRLDATSRAYEDDDLRVRDGQGALRVAQHEAAVRQGPDPRRRDHQRDGGHQGPLPGRALGDAPRLRGAADAHTGREKRYPKPDGKYTFDKLSRRLPDRQRDARRRAVAHPDPAAGAARGRRGLGLDVPRRRLRGPRGRARRRG